MVEKNYQTIYRRKKGKLSKVPWKPNLWWIISQEAQQTNKENNQNRTNIQIAQINEKKRISRITASGGIYSKKKKQLNGLFLFPAMPRTKTGLEFLLIHMFPWNTQAASTVRTAARRKQTTGKTKDLDKWIETK